MAADVQRSPHVDRSSPGLVSSFTVSAMRPLNDVVRHVLDPRRTLHKYIAHVLVCLFIPGPYFHDALVGTYKTQMTATDVLDVSSTKFSLLFAIPSAMGIFCGFMGPLVARHGEAKSSVFAGLIVLASAIGVVAGLAQHNFEMMLVSRVIFWLSLYALLSIQTMVIYKLFKGPELAIASGFSIVACRCGGMSGCFFSGLMLSWCEDNLVCAMGGSLVVVAGALVATISFSYLRGGSATARAVLPNMLASGTSALSFKEQLGTFTNWTWVVVGQLSLIYGAIFPFEAIATDFFISDWHLNPVDAGATLSLAPFFGLFAWSFGLVVKTTRTQLFFGTVAWAGFIVAFMLMRLQVTSNPTLPMCVLGVSYAYQTTMIWSVLPATLLSTEGSTAAVSLSYALVAVSQVLSNVFVGVLHDHFSYGAVCIWMIFQCFGGFVLCIVMFCKFPKHGVATAEHLGPKQDSAAGVAVDPCLFQGSSRESRVEMTLTPRRDADAASARPPECPQLQTLPQEVSIRDEHFMTPRAPPSPSMPGLLIQN